MNKLDANKNCWSIGVHHSKQADENMTKRKWIALLSFEMNHN